MHERDQKAAFEALGGKPTEMSTFLQNHISRSVGPDSIEYVKAFERNCPGVRMTPDERRELVRLFFEATQTNRSPQ